VRRLVVSRPDGTAEEDQNADDDEEAAHRRMMPAR
jgi:hypothetical protein